MLRTRNPAIDELATQHGIILDYNQSPSMDFLPRHPERDKTGALVPGKYGNFDAGKVQLAIDELMAMDAPPATTYAQPTLVTAPNAGILSLLTTYIDPKLIDVLLSPTKAAEIYGEAKKGDWTLQTAAFGLVENTGEVSAYGDFNEVGMTGVNVNWPQRQSFLFQAIMEYGDLESDRMALARIDWVARKRIAVAIALGYFLNLTYFFGVQGSQQLRRLERSRPLPCADPIDQGGRRHVLAECAADRDRGGRAGHVQRIAGQYARHRRQSRS